KGKLSMKVSYFVEDRKLKAENGIVLDQLTFGQKVESPDAIKAPVLLAVALLKDRNGVIKFDLPVGGSLDDPQFSVGALVFRALGGLRRSDSRRIRAAADACLQGCRLLQAAQRDRLPEGPAPRRDGSAARCQCRGERRRSARACGAARAGCPFQSDRQRACSRRTGISGCASPRRAGRERQGQSDAGRLRIA